LEISAGQKPIWQFILIGYENLRNQPVVLLWNETSQTMKIEILPDAAAAASAAAVFVAAEWRAANTERRPFVAGLSGGSTPWLMLRALAHEQVTWDTIKIVQVDERIAPAGNPDRNLTHLKETLKHTPLRLEQIHAMPVDSPDPEAAARQYEQTLSDLAGSLPVLDLVHLGLGVDGHTASLVPGDPVLDITDRDVAITGIYQGRRRMTLTYPILNRARRVLWLVSGAEKATALQRLQTGDRSIPAGRIRRDFAVVFADRQAASKISS
jgi:6-phosphogluconolactonase